LRQNIFPLVCSSHQHASDVTTFFLRWKPLEMKTLPVPPADYSHFYLMRLLSHYAREDHRLSIQRIHSVEWFWFKRNIYETFHLDTMLKRSFFLRWLRCSYIVCMTCLQKRRLKNAAQNANDSWKITLHDSRTRSFMITKRKNLIVANKQFLINIGGGNFVCVRQHKKERKKRKP
jgi:hypothetical protein